MSWTKHIEDRNLKGHGWKHIENRGLSGHGRTHIENRKLKGHGRKPIENRKQRKIRMVAKIVTAFIVISLKCVTLSIISRWEEG